VSSSQITRESLLRAIAAGWNTRPLLGERFEVLPTFRALTDVLDPLITSALVVEHDGGVLHVNDLIEQLPHEPEEGR
jgi:hypothetical protein